MEEEIWKDIEGYEGLYQVSNYGIVKSIDRFIIKTNGIIEHRKEKLIYKKIDKYGYVIYALCKKNTIKHLKGHRLVAKAFIPNPENKSQVNHIDTNKSNNYYKNLEWATHKENAIHAYNNGRYILTNGEKNGQSKLKNEDVIKMREMFNIGNCSQSELSKKFNIAPSAVCKIINKKRWKHL